MAQPKPHAGDKYIYPLVLADLARRVQEGCQQYGTFLQSNNGRDALWDAYEEALDLVMYLRQAIEERSDP